MIHNHKEIQSNVKLLQNLLLAIKRKVVTLKDVHLHIFATAPLPGDTVRVLTVVIVSTPGTGVSAPLLPDDIETLPPLVKLLVTGVVGPRLLGEVGEHGGQRLPADGVARLLPPHVGADGGELGDGLEQPPVGVAGVVPGEQVLVVLLGQDELHSLDIVRIGWVTWGNFLHKLRVKSLDSLLHFNKLRIFCLQSLFSLSGLPDGWNSGVVWMRQRGHF